MQPDKDIEKLFQELQVHQIELEMQNDELRIVNEEMELQRLKLANIYKLAPLGYFILDEHGLIEEVNEAGHATLLDGGKSSLIGKRLQKFIYYEQSDKFYHFLTLIRHSGKRQSIQLKMVSQSGNEFDAQLEGIAVRASFTGQLQYYIAIVDISENVLAKKHLFETSERLELALQTSNASIWDLDTETMKLESATLSKLPRFNQTYQSFLEVLHPNDREEADQHFRLAVNQQREVDLICRIDDATGNYHYYTLKGHAVTRNGANQCFVGMMIDITERKKAEEEVQRREQDHQRSLTMAVLKGQENARRRISEALHDGVSQLLYGIKMKLSTLKDQAALGGVYDMLDMAVTETRNISFELAPAILADFGLPTTLDELAMRFSGPDLKIRTRFSGMENRLDLSLETGIFRIIQELLNNCMKHAAASLILIEIKKNKTVNIIVKDNGQGFLLHDKEHKPSGSGLSSIRNRVNLYNGSMQIETAPGKGTTVRVSLPY